MSSNRVDAAWKSALLGRLDIVDVVRDAGVELKLKGGSEWVGLCPFHQDSNPSFGANRDKQICTCWSGCGSFDAIGFYEKHAGVGFLDACRQLGARVGMALPGEELAAVPGAPAPRVATAEELAAAAAKKLAQEKEGEWRRAAAINHGRKLWADAAGKQEDWGTGPAYLDGRGTNHPRAVAYFAARGIPIASLPGGQLPKSIRFLGSCPFKTEEAEGMPAKVPCIVSKWIDDPTTNTCTGVHRIALDLGGLPVKLKVERAKLTLGSFRNGGCIPLSPKSETGLLIVCEGVETGLAIAAAMGETATVWALAAAEFVKAWKLGIQHVSDPKLGWVKRVIIAADTDKSRAGTRCSEACAKQLRKDWPRLPVAIAMAGHTELPEAVDPTGTLIDLKTVDWLDVVAKHGAAESRRMFLAAAERIVLPLGETGGGGGSGGGGGGGGGDGSDSDDEHEGDWDEVKDITGRPILPAEPTRRAQYLLRRVFKPKQIRDGVWLIQRFGGKWWVYGRVGGVVRWREIAEDALFAIVRQDVDRFVEWKKNGYKPAAITLAKIGELMHAATLWTTAAGDAMPQWLPSSFTAGGNPRWLPTLGLDRYEAVPELRAEDVVTFANGLLDVAAWCRGELKLVPPTPRWFCATALTYNLPVDELRQIDAACDEEVSTLARQLAPNWHRVVRECLSGDDSLVSTLAEWYGYCLVPDNSLQRMLWLQGSPGSGKGTLMEGFMAMIGEDSVAQSTIDRLGDKYTASGFVGKLAVLVPEIHVDHRTPMAAATTFIKTLTGGGPIPIEDKFMPINPHVRLTARLIFTPNEEPKIFDASNALERRLLVVPTGMPIALRDPTLYAKIRAEAVGIMLWGLVGLRRLRRRGDFIQPMAGRAIVEEMKRQMSPVGAFASDVCVVGTGNSTRTELLYDLYKKWCEVNGYESPKTREQFGKELRAAVPGVKKHRFQGTLVDKFYYLGIRPRLAGADSVAGPRAALHVERGDELGWLPGDSMVLNAGPVSAAAGVPVAGPWRPPTPSESRSGQGAEVF